MIEKFFRKANRSAHQSSDPVLNRLFIPSMLLVSCLPTKCLSCGSTVRKDSRLSVINKSISNCFSFIITFLIVSLLRLPIVKTIIHLYQSHRHTASILASLCCQYNSKPIYLYAAAILFLWLSLYINRCLF